MTPLVASLDSIKGEVLALSCALSWAVSVILFKRSEAVPPQAMSLFKNIVAVTLLGLTLVVTGTPIDWQRTNPDWLRLVVSGIIGITFSDLLFFMALRRLGPGLLAVVECIYAPMTVLLSVVILGEQLGGSFKAGAALVIVGLLIVTTDGRRDPLRPRTGRRLPGVLLGLFGVTGLAVAVVIAKPALAHGALVELTLIRMVAGIVAQLIWVLSSARQRAAVLPVFRPSRVWVTLMPAAVLGSYLSTLLWIGGFKYADASVAAVLNQMTTVFIILLARLFLHEPLTARRMVGAAAAIAGALIIVG